MKKSWLKEPLFWILCYLVGLPLLFAAYLGWEFYVSWRCGEGYEKIRRGDSEPRVLALMGRPSSTAPDSTPIDSWDGERLPWSGDGATSTSVKVYEWRGMSMIGESYLVGFDAIGRAVVKSHLSSP